MPTGDVVTNGPRPGPSAPDSPSSENVDPSSSPAHPALQTRTMTSKSASITARKNYISPYRQTSGPRSVSSPIAPRSTPGPGNNAGSPNFKNIVDRFNVGNDEKVPVPTNRIPASAVAATKLPKERRTPTPNEGRRASASTAANPKHRAPVPTSRTRAPSIRSDSSPIPHPAAASFARPGAPVPTVRTRRASSPQASDVSKSRPTSKTLPALQTNFDRGPFKNKAHLRPSSAAGNSPSAASMADNEDDSTDSPGPPRSHALRHRRSRSLVENRSPQKDIEHQELRQSPGSPRASPRVGRSAIPVTVRRDSLSARSSARNSMEVQPSESARGVGERTPRPANLRIQNTNKAEEKSPPLRSSRQRLPVAANTATHASRQRMQPATSLNTKGSKVPRGRTSFALEESKRKMPQRKIPEIGTVDFAARRARIQASYAKNMKEDEERKALEAKKAEEARKAAAAQAAKEAEEAAAEAAANQAEPEKSVEPEATPTKEETPSPKEDEQASDSSDDEQNDVADFIRRGHIISLAPGSVDSMNGTTVVDDDEVSDSGSGNTSLLEALGSMALKKEEKEEPPRPEMKSTNRYSFFETGSGVGMPGGWDNSPEIEPVPSYPSPPVQPKPTSPSLSPKQPIQNRNLLKVTLPEGDLHSAVDIPSPVDLPSPQEYTSTPQDYSSTTHQNFGLRYAVEPPSPIITVPAEDPPSPDQLHSAIEPPSPKELHSAVDLPSPSYAWKPPSTPASPEFFDHWKRLSLAPNDSVSAVATPILPRQRHTFSEASPSQATVFKQVAEMLGEATSPQWSNSSTISTETPQPAEPSGIYENSHEGQKWPNRRESLYGVPQRNSYRDSQMTSTSTGEMINIAMVFDKSEIDGWESTCGDSDGEDGETEVGGRNEDDSCSEVPDSAYPDDNGHNEDNEEGWATETEHSPENSPVRSPQDDEYDPYNPDLYTIPKLGTPTTPKPIELSLKLPPTPPPKDEPPPPPMKDWDLHTPAEPHPTTSFEDYTEGMGLGLQALPSHFDFRPANGQRPNSYHTEEYYGHDAGAGENRKISYESSRPSFDTYSTRPSLDRYMSYDEGRSPSSSFYGSERGSRPVSQHYPAELDTAATSMSTIPRTSIADEGEEKRLRQRYHVLKELLETESRYFRDMTVLEEIYKGSASACSAITSDDVKVLFINSEELVNFTRTFLEVLKAAVAPVYVSGLGRTQSQRSSTADADGGSGPPNGTNYERDNEEDRRTYVGEAFAEVLYRLEKVYTEWTIHQKEATTRYHEIKTRDAVKIWLDQCSQHAKDLTTAWDLDSLMLKPFQRVTKYPLLLQQLLKETPPGHPDHDALEISRKEMENVLNRINTAITRREIVQKVVTKKDNNLVHGASKGISRSAHKLLQSMQAAGGVQDDKYNRLFQNYNTHFVRLQLIARDFLIYCDHIGGHLDYFLQYSHLFREFGEVEGTRHPEIEDKWRRYDMTMREIASTYLQEHKMRVKAHCIQPLEILLQLHQSPQKVMYKRNKKSQDYARWKAVTDKGETPDRKLQLLAEEYVALNDTLIEELPKLFSLTKKLIEATLINFIDLQAQWMKAWATKIKMTFMDLTLPTQLEVIVDAFVADFAFNEEHMKQLSICNGVLKDSLENGSLHTVSTNDSGSMAPPISSRRPRTAHDPIPNRDRALSLTNQTITFPGYDTDGRRHSGGATLMHSPTATGVTISPFTAMAPVLPLPPLLGPSNRTRTVSAAVLPSAAMAGAPLPPMPQRAQTSTNTPKLPDSHAAAQASYATSMHSTMGSNNDRQPFQQHTQQPLSRAAAIAAASGMQPLSLGMNVRDRSPSPPLPSAFSSAMPMEDDRDRDDSGSGNNVSRASSIHQSRSVSRTPSVASSNRRTLTLGPADRCMFVAASMYEFNINKERREAGFPYLTYVVGELFDVIGIKGEIWLARNQDDPKGEIGWIWEKHFQKIPGSEDGEMAVVDTGMFQ